MEIAQEKPQERVESQVKPIFSVTLDIEMSQIRLKIRKAALEKIYEYYKGQEGCVENGEIIDCKDVKRFRREYDYDGIIVVVINSHNARDYNYDFRYSRAILYVNLAKLRNKSTWKNLGEYYSITIDMGDYYIFKAHEVMLDAIVTYILEILNKIEGKI